MRTSRSTYVLKLALTNALAALLAFSSASASDPLIDRDGRTFQVLINGVPTKREPVKKINDSEGLEAFEVYWSASVGQVPLCFSVETKDARLGKPERINILIHELRKDRPMQRWKNYDTVPSTSEAMNEFLTPKGYCPKEYTLTERLRYPSLPPGEYVFRLGYWGEGNWDRQDILVTITP